MAENFTAIPDGDVDPESPITTSLMQALRDNPEGIAKAASGAPTIVYGALALSNDINQGDIAASAIGQGELKTATATDDFAPGSTSHTIVSLTGGQWSFAPRIRYRNDAGGSKDYAAYYGRAIDLTSNPVVLVDENRTTDTGIGLYMTLYMTNTGGGEGTRVEHRYIQASPPYDLGDGECGLFVQVVIDEKGAIVASCVSPDPVWANNGPTNIRPDFIDRRTGKGYRRIRRPQLCREDLEAGRCDMADYLAAQREAPVEDVEVTHALKNADMDLFPHSWVSPPQGTICLLDPVNTHDLLMLHEAGEDVADLIHKGYVQIGDEVKRKGPPGVVPVTFKWRNSR